jgi:hypothetical protein
MPRDGSPHAGVLRCHCQGQKKDMSYRPHLRAKEGGCKGGDREEIESDWVAMHASYYILEQACMSHGIRESIMPNHMY